MPLLQQVEDDPFTPQLQPVDHDPFSPSPADTASMTHQAEQPNPARPIIDAARAFAGGGLQGVANTQGVSTPEWSQRLGAVLSSPEANAALGVMTPLGKGITAFHGSPHDFGAFDLSKIGTGEGAQSYGHGLYFAQNEGVAQSYRDVLGGQNTNWDRPDEIAGHFLDLTGGNRDSAAGLLNAFMSRPTAKQQYNLSALGDARDLLKSGAEIAPPKGSGKMYQVAINADPEHFLDWDKPLSEQSPKVQEALTDKMGLDPKHGNLSGHALMDRITNEVIPYGQATNENISNSLRAAGIPGIKYLDQGSRGAGSGTRNYVVFDDKLISIMKKYGIAGLGALPAMGAYHFQTAPTDNDPFAR
jgi:hypothetical protein